MPQRSTDTVRPECARNLQCQLCECVLPFTNQQDGLDHGILPYFRERLFHDTCTTCSPTEPSLEPLCSFCNHLRLPHIFGCVNHEFENLSSISRVTGFSTKWGKGYTELLEDQACPLCALVGKILRKRTTRMDQDDGDFFDDSVSAYFSRTRDSSGKSGPWELSISPSWPIMRSNLILIRIGIMNAAKDGSGKAPYSDPLVSPDINWDLMRQWVWKCHLDHSSREIPIDSIDKTFRLIDVRNNCLISASKACSYAALSYVWGDLGAREARAVLANVSQLEQKGGLLLHELPQCILDAMTACKCLGIEFLWVDRLCIVQDDAKSKHGQIKQMGNIYASAVVTIVAAAGKNASYGLVGVSKPRAFVQQRLLLQGIEFTEALHADDFSDSIQQSVWRSRGWTFQEEKLSTALLIFSERGVSFQCKHRPGRMEIEGLGRSNISTASGTYPSVVSEYSQRKLTFGSDIINAFSGYLGTTFEDQHYFGLPYAYFNQALLWKSADDSGPRRENNDIETFPSWSWASVIGAVDYKSWLCSGNHESIASWAAIEFPPGRTPQLFPVCEAPSTLPSLLRLLKESLFCDDWAIAGSYRSWWKKSGGLKSRTMLKAAWRRDLVKQRFLSPILHGELNRVWTTFPRWVKSNEGFWLQNKWLWIKHDLFHFIAGLDPHEVFRKGRLLAYTEIANVSVTRLLWPTSFVLQKKAPFVLRNKWGKWIGFANPDRPTAERIDAYKLRGEPYLVECLALYLHKENAQTLPLLLDEDFDTLQDQESEPHDDEESREIFRKRSHDFWTEMGCLEHQIHQNTKRSTKRARIHYSSKAFPPQLTVMMIERTEGVARRVGVGNVYLRRWRESAPSFQTVILE